MAKVKRYKPVVWRIPVNGDWFYGTKEQCARERAEYESTFTAEDFEDAGTVEPEPLACLDKVKEMNYQGHASDCSTNNRGVPELLGPCDCALSKKTP